MNEEQISKARALHSDKFDYAEVGEGPRILLRCPDHGAFFTTISSHLKGEGCPRCAGHFW